MLDATIIQQKEITRLEHPSKRDLNALQEWMRRDDMGGVYLVGEDSNLWSDPEWQSDLLALRVREHESVFAQWISDKVVWWIHYTCRRSKATVSEGSPAFREEENN